MLGLAKLLGVLLLVKHCQPNYVHTKAVQQMSFVVLGAGAAICGPAQAVPDQRYGHARLAAGQAQGLHNAGGTQPACQ